MWQTAVFATSYSTRKDFLFLNDAFKKRALKGMAHRILFRFVIWDAWSCKKSHKNKYARIFLPKKKTNDQTLAQICSKKTTKYYIRISFIINIIYSISDFL